MKISLLINDARYQVEARPDTSLLTLLRELGFKSVKKGCDSTSCGICTILVDGAPVPSCTYLAYRAEGRRITTVEGITKEAALLADYFGEYGADQCGFCNPGLALTVYAMKKELRYPTKEAIVHYLNGNLCRCSGYVAQQEAIYRYMEVEG